VASRNRLIGILAAHATRAPLDLAKRGIGPLLYPLDRGRAGELATANFRERVSPDVG
jgi:hypothetical protein